MKRCNQSEARLLRSLAKRQTAIRSRGNDLAHLADDLWGLWLEAAQFRNTAGELWPAGRDGAATLLVGRRHDEGMQRFRQYLETLSRFHLHDASAASIRTVYKVLSEDQLLEVLNTSALPLETLRRLPVDLLGSAKSVAEARFGQAPNESTGILLGRLLEVTQSNATSLQTTPMETVDEDLAESAALHFLRSHGVETVVGIVFEALYAFWRLLTDPTVIRIDLQDLEDLRVTTRNVSGQESVEHVQVKKRDTDWSIPDLQSQSSSSNSVFDSFAEVALVEPHSALRFVSDAMLNRGYAANLVRAAAKFRNVSDDPERLLDFDVAKVALSANETAALRQLTERMRPDLLERVNIPTLLAKVTFDTGRSRRELRSETIRAISRLLHVADPLAEQTYFTFLGTVIEAMQSRKCFTREEVLTLLTDASRRAGAFNRGALATQTFEYLDFTVGPQEESAARYYQGRAATPADIAAGRDALRPKLLAEIRQILGTKPCCIIRAPSGQGKSTLLYRFAYETLGEWPIFRLHRLDQRTVDEFVGLLPSLNGLPVLLIIDDLTAGPNGEWLQALRRLMERPEVKILATSREADWRLSSVFGLETEVGFVTPRLDQHTAESLFEGLSAVPGLELQYQHWFEPFQLANGLLAEFVHLLTQGRMMKALIAEQIGFLERRLTRDPATILGALRLISSAHALGGFLTRATLMQVLGTPSAVGLGRALQALEEEFWVVDVAEGRYTGLHQVRSEVVMAVLHERDPFDETLLMLVEAASDEELSSMAEGIFQRWPLLSASLQRAIINRVLTANPDSLTELLSFAFAADEQRYLKDVVPHVIARLPNRAATMLARWATAPKFAALDALIGLRPANKQMEAAMFVASLPQREDTQRVTAALLESLGSERIARAVMAIAPQEAAFLLGLLERCAPNQTSAVVGQLRTLGVEAHLRGLPPKDLALLLGALRDVDYAQSVEIADELGTNHLIEQHLACFSECYAVRVTGTEVGARFFAIGPDDSVPHQVALDITETLYRLFPLAQTSDVKGFFDVGVVAFDGEKRIPRENMPPAGVYIQFNTYWSAIFDDIIAAKSLFPVLVQHDACLNALDALVDAVVAYFENRSLNRKNLAIENLRLVEAKFDELPLLPSQSVPSLVRPQESDRVTALDSRIQAVATPFSNASRELTSLLSGRKHNQAILTDQLAKVRTAIAEYSQTRESSEFWNFYESEAQSVLDFQLQRLENVVAMVGNPSFTASSEANKLKWEEFRRVYLLANSLFVGQRPNPSDAEIASPTISEQEDVIARLGTAFWASCPHSELALMLKKYIELALGASGEHDIREGELTLVGAKLERIRPIDFATEEHEYWHINVRERWAAELKAVLAEHGITADSAILPPERAQPLLRNCAAVVIHGMGLGQLIEKRTIIRKLVFQTLPDDVASMVVFLGITPEEVHPTAFQSWRYSAISSMPAGEILFPDGWLPITDLSTYLAAIGCGKAHREHPAYQQLDELRCDFSSVAISFVRFSLVCESLSDVEWVSSFKTVADQIQTLSDSFSAFIQKFDQTWSFIIESYPDWNSELVMVTRALDSYFTWIVLQSTNERSEQNTNTHATALSSAWAACEMRLYKEPATSPAVDTAGEVERLALSLERFASQISYWFEQIAPENGEDPG